MSDGKTYSLSSSHWLTRFAVENLRDLVSELIRCPKFDELCLPGRTGNLQWGTCHSPTSTASFFSQLTLFKCMSIMLDPTKMLASSAYADTPTGE